MSADLTLAAILRLTADTDGIPAEFTKGVLHAIADGLEDDADEGLSCIHIINQTAPEAGEAPAQEAPVEVVKANYQWKLKDGLRHKDGRAVEWRDVTEDLVGRPVSEFTKSIFREKPVATTSAPVAASEPTASAASGDEGFVAVSEGVVAAGDQWKLKDGLRHKDGRAVEWREVTEDLVGRPISDFTKSVIRRPVASAASATAAPAAVAAQGLDEISVQVDVGEDFEQLKLRDILEDGDEWQLKPGLRHKDGRAVEWREVGEELLGRPVSDFPKSVFRRPI